jgi:quercetin dioxygenase-like cupin family protein
VGQSNLEGCGKMEILKTDSLAKFSLDKYVRVLIPNTNGLVRLLCFEPGQSVAFHRHPDGDEVLYVVMGKADFTVGKETARVEAGSFVKAAAGSFHGWNNGSERLILISMLVPSSSYNLAEQTARMEFL